MKTLALLFLSSFAVACNSGCTEWNGVCACSAASKDAPAKEETKPSDEKPPKDKMPSYEREGVHAAMLPSCASTNNCSDQQAIDATIQGKKKAGIIK